MELYKKIEAEKLKNGMKTRSLRLVLPVLNWHVVSNLEVTTDNVEYTATYENGDQEVIVQSRSVVMEVLVDVKIVEKYYPMDPDTEDVLPDSDYLANGLIVLVENPDLRASERDMELDWGKDRALVNNRWCKVTDLSWNAASSAYQFIAVYEDGTKRVRRFPRDTAWLVTLKSMEEVAYRKANRSVEVQELVRKALLEQDAITHLEQKSDIPGLAESTAKQIMSLF